MNTVANKKSVLQENKFFRYSILFLMLLILSACSHQTTEISSSGDTPTEVFMEVLGLGESIILTPDGEPVERTITDPSRLATFITTTIDEDRGVKFSGFHRIVYCGVKDNRVVNGSNSYRQPDPEIGSDGPVATISLFHISNFSFFEYLRACEELAINRNFEYNSITLEIFGFGASFYPERRDTATFTLILDLLDRLTVDAPDLIPEPDNPLPEADFSLPAMVRIPTLCYFGPGAEFEIVSSLAEGLEVEIIGIDGFAIWWIIDNPRFPGVACWVEQNDLEVDPSVDVSPLPEYEVPPLPDLEDDDGGEGSSSAFAPASPSGLTEVTTIFNQTCKVKLIWNDNANNESGYRIYRDGSLIATVGANTTTFTDIDAPNDLGYTYTVRAYNGSGQSSAATVNSEGCFG